MVFQDLDGFFKRIVGFGLSTGLVNVFSKDRFFRNVVLDGLLVFQSDRTFVGLSKGTGSWFSKGLVCLF